MGAALHIIFTSNVSSNLWRGRPPTYPTWIDVPLGETNQYDSLLPSCGSYWHGGCQFHSTNSLCLR